MEGWGAASPTKPSGSTLSGRSVGAANCKFVGFITYPSCVLQVYSILTVQLIVTMAFIGFFFIPSVKGFSAAHPGILYAAMAFSIILMLALVCVESIRRKTPHNMIFLGLFTVCEGWLIGDHKNVYF